MLLGEAASLLWCILLWSYYTCVWLPSKRRGRSWNQEYFRLFFFIRSLEFWSRVDQNPQKLALLYLTKRCLKLYLGREQSFGKSFRALNKSERFPAWYFTVFFSFSKRGSYRHIQTNIHTNVITVILLFEYTNLHMYNVLLFLVKIYPKREGICPKTIPLLERECRVIENHPG